MPSTTRTEKSPSSVRLQPDARDGAPVLSLTTDGRLLLEQADCTRSVKAVRCFPWSRATAHISLRDEKNTELCFVESIDALDEASRSALQRAISLAGFVLVVTRVLSITEDYEIRLWKVVTRSGPRSFQTALDSWPRSRPHGGHIIDDIAGDVYFIPEFGTLDAESQRLLWPYVD